MDTMFFGPSRSPRRVLPHMRERGQRRDRPDELDGRAGLAARLRRLLLGEVRARGDVGGARHRGRAVRHPRADRRSRARSAPSSAARACTVSRDSGLYAETAGQNRAYIAGVDGTQPGDPRKAAAAIVAALDAPDAPLRLALGDDAVDAIRAKHERLRADLDAWEAVSRATAVA